MAIRNYSTRVPVTNTLGKVTTALAKRGVQQISTTFGDDGTPAGLTFALHTDFGVRNFSLPVKIDGVLAHLKQDHSLTPSQKTPARAKMIAWRNAQDWLETQFALIDAGMAELDEVFMPWMIDITGNTMYQLYRDQQAAIEP